MSESAILTAVQERIRTVLNLPDARWIDIRPDGRPTSAVVADAFISVFSEGQRYGKLNNAIDEYQRIGVTVSLKTGAYHIDYWGTKTQGPWTSSMEYAVRKIIGAIHLKPEVIQAANNLLDTAISSKFCEMLEVRQAESSKAQGASWWGTESSARGNANQTIGWSRTIHFDGARRIQSMDSYT